MLASPSKPQQLHIIAIASRGEPRSPLPRQQVDADDAVLASGSLLLCSAERVESVRDSRVGESGGLERVSDLCFQQSPCDSTGPQVDILPRILRERDAQSNVRDL